MEDRAAAGLVAISSRLINRSPFDDDAGLSFAGSKKGLRETGLPLDVVDGAGSRNGDVGLGIEGETARARKGLFEERCDVRTSADRRRRSESGVFQKLIPKKKLKAGGPENKLRAG